MILNVGFCVCFDGSGLEDLPLAKKDVSRGVDERLAERARADWKHVSHVGTAPNVAIDDTCMTMCAGEAASEFFMMGTVERTSWRPSHPNEVCFEGCETVGFCLDGALPRNAARMTEKS